MNKAIRQKEIRQKVIKAVKRTLLGIVAASVISGTYFGRGNDDFPPMHSHKTGDCYGINVAICTDISPGARLYGLNLSLFTRNYGEINGATISLAHIGKYGRVNGLEAGFTNGIDDYEKIELDAAKKSSINGLAIAMVNCHKKLNGMQIGIYNKTQDNAGIMLNVDYQKK